jgi:hypothetical protein
MDAHQVSLRLYFDVEGELDLEAIVPVFHAWIRESRLPDEVMIDVADYAHVPDGPGVLLVCHEGHYVVEHRGGRWSLVYNRKRGGEGTSLQERIRVPLRRLARAATLLQDDTSLGAKLTFTTDELVLRVANRLDAPNNDDTLAAMRDDLQRVLAGVYGEAPTVTREGEPRELFTLRIRGSSPGLAQLG